MKILKPFVIALSASLVLSSCGEKKSETHSEDHEVNYKYEYEQNERDPLNTLVYTLDNGLKVYMSINKAEPRIQTNIAIKTGSKQDPSDATGLAHYLEHMVFKGTSKMGSLDWEKEKVLLQEISDLYEAYRATEVQEEKSAIYHQIDSISGIAAKYVVPNEYDQLMASIGVKGSNAYTSLERTVYIGDIPSNELEKWLKIESERFSELVLRLFHTELEAVYEEFNGGQDSDGNLAWETLYGELFKKHTYGTQTTIGKGEHLKNPSMVKIHDYFDTYYVPNNMAIILAGDIDPDQTVDLIKQYFGEYERKDIPEFTFEKEDPISTPQIVDLYGEDAEFMMMAYRLPGLKGENMHVLEVLDELMANGQAGLIDLNLLLPQKVLDAYSYADINQDYSAFMIGGAPRPDQSLEECRNLLLAEVENLKNGHFDEQLLPALMKNRKLSMQKQLERNNSRASIMTDHFILERTIEEWVTELERKESVSKEDIVNFAKANFSNNYVVVNKNEGERKSYKVEKPVITPVPLNRDTSSLFAEEVSAFESGRLKPAFIDFEKDITKLNLKDGNQFLGVKNEVNQLFEMSYIIDMGSHSDKEFALAAEYLQYLGTDKYGPAELEEEFYKLGLSFDVNSSNKRIYISLSGLEESFKEGVELVEHILANVQPDQLAYEDLVAGILKRRSDAKLNKGAILRSAMASYATYGADSPQKHIISEEELTSMDVNRLIAKINGFTTYKHIVSYYGTQDFNDVKTLLDEAHVKTDEPLDLIAAKEFNQVETDKNRVLFVDFNMVQAEILMLSKSQTFNTNELAEIGVFNTYFGGGMSSVVFQEMREARALAYSAYGTYSSPSQPDESHYIKGYIGTQGDKMQDAIEGLMELLNELPKSDGQFNDAKMTNLIKAETTRPKGSSYVWRYLNAIKMTNGKNLNSELYQKLEGIEYKDIQRIFDERIKGANYTFLVIGNKKTLDMNYLKSLGEFEELSMEEIFGY